LRLATLAKIKPESQTHFFVNTRELIREAHISHKLFCAGSKTHRAVLQRLKRIAAHADKLTAELQGVVAAGQSANGDPERTFTYDFLDEAIHRPGSWSSPAWKSDQRLAELVQQLNDFRAVAERAEQNAKGVWGRKGRPAGAGGNYAFDLVVQQLYLNARSAGGRLTNARRADGQWSGSFIDALNILKPYLPDFFPPAELGRTVDNIVRKLPFKNIAPRNKHKISSL
jgi:hypothetical protein